MLVYGFVNFHFDLMFLLSKKTTSPYLAQVKELLLASSCCPPSLQMTWYAQALPLHPTMSICRYIIFLSVSVWLLWTWNTYRAQLVLNTYKYTMTIKKCIHIPKEKCIHYISQSHVQIFEEHLKWAYIFWVLIHI